MYEPLYLPFDGTTFGGLLEQLASISIWSHSAKGWIYHASTKLSNTRLRVHGRPTTAGSAPNVKIYFQFLSPLLSFV